MTPEQAKARAEILRIDLEQGDADFTKAVIKMLIAELVVEGVDLDEILNELRPGWQRVYEAMRTVAAAMEGLKES